MTTPIVGFVSPPEWFDPSPAEFATVCDVPVRTQQAPLPLPAFSYAMADVALTEPDLAVAARTLGRIGASVACLVGTPFGWAGTGSVEGARRRTGRLSEAAGVPIVSAALAIVDTLQELGVGHVGLATTYYDRDWQEAWAGFVGTGGLKITASGLVDQGIWDRTDARDQDYWAPTADDIERSVVTLAQDIPDVEAIVVTGSGCRTLSSIAALEGATGVPVMGADTALYRAAAKVAGVPLKPGILGRIGDLP